MTLRLHSQFLYEQCANVCMQCFAKKLVFVRNGWENLFFFSQHFILSLPLHIIHACYNCVCIEVRLWFLKKKVQKQPWQNVKIGIERRIFCKTVLVELEWNYSQIFTSRISFPFCFKKIKNLLNKFQEKVKFTYLSRIFNFIKLVCISWWIFNFHSIQKS